VTGANEPVSLHLAVLADELTNLRNAVQQLSTGQTRVDMHVGDDGVCAGVAGVGTSLTTQQRPSGGSAAGWQHLERAQRALQVACGEVLVRLRTAEHDGYISLHDERLAAASRHLDRACSELNAAAESMSYPGYRC
jgi:hypothetical protein